MRILSFHLIYLNKDDTFNVHCFTETVKYTQYKKNSNSDENVPCFFRISLIVYTRLNVEHTMPSFEALKL